MIKILATDIDGVLTDGKKYISNADDVMKSVSFQDVDSVSNLLANGIKLAIITGENDAFTDYIKNMFNPDYMFTGTKKKLDTIIELAKTEECELNNIAYIGDGKYDIDVLNKVAFGFAPKDSIPDALRAANIILESSSGKGCFRESVDYIIQYNKRCLEEKPINHPSINEDINRIVKEHKGIVSIIEGSEEIKGAIEKAIELILDCFKNNGQVLLCGNGGSASDAQHIATEFVSRFFLERKALNAEALTVNTSSITAISNDYEYNEVFSRQIEAKGKPDDVLIGITTSGRSENIINALTIANKIGMKTISLIGENSFSVSGLSDVVVSVPIGSTPRIQEMHIMIGHIICEEVERRLFG